MDFVVNNVNLMVAKLITCIYTQLFPFCRISEAFDITCIFRSSPPKVLLGKSVLKLYSKCTAEFPCLRVISIKLHIEFTLWHGCSPVILLHIFRTYFPKNTSRKLLLYFIKRTFLPIWIMFIIFVKSSSIVSFFK